MMEHRNMLMIEKHFGLKKKKVLEELEKDIIVISVEVKDLV